MIFRSTSLIILTLFVISAIGCGGNAVDSTKNANISANGNSGPVTVDPSNLPPGLSANPIQQPANMPGVNANVVQPKGGTPTPGIPSPDEIRKPVKPGATPTPGIPSPEEIKKMLAKPGSAVNAPTVPMKGSDVPMMKSNKPMSGKPTPQN